MSIRPATETRPHRVGRMGVRYLDPAQQIAQLTDRQREAIEAYIAEGDQRLAAERMGIGTQTLKNHLSAVMDKLGVHSSLQAAVRYDRWKREHTWPDVERRTGYDRRGDERRQG